MIYWLNYFQNCIHLICLLRFLFLKPSVSKKGIDTTETNLLLFMFCQFECNNFKIVAKSYEKCLAC